MTIEDGILLSGLYLPRLSFVTDPALADGVEVEYEMVGLAQPTMDPNRVTIHVPTEKTVLSLGAASDRWKTDIGITGYTDNHVHFETKVNDKTVVSLGGPATTAAIKGHGPKAKEKKEEKTEPAPTTPTTATTYRTTPTPEPEPAAEPEGEEKLAPVATEGYSMVTAERAWHDSIGQHYLLSQKEDISMLTLAADKRAVVQADLGYVDLNGGEEINLSGGGVAIGAALKFPIEDILYDKNFTGKSPTSTFAKTAKVGMDLIGAVFSAHDLGLKAFKTAKKQKAGKLKKNEFFYADVVKWVTDSVKFGMSVNKLQKVFAHVSSPPGSVKISAEQDVVGLAGADACFSGTMGASIASTAATTISAGMTASMKGTLFAGVGSVLTTLKGQKKIEVSSTYGDVVFSAKKNVEFTSDDEFIAASSEDAQVTGKKHLLLGAGKHAFIGVEKGWGALFDDSGIAFGKASGVGKLKSAKIEASPAIRIDSGKIEIVRESAAVTLSDDLCLIEAPAIHFDSKAKNVTFNGKMAVLD
jgi:hypothetical protein